jgi:hypothetical protein
MLEIFSPAKQLLSFQFISIWVESGHCPAVGYYKQDKENCGAKEREKRILAFTWQSVDSTHMAQNRAIRLVVLNNKIIGSESFLRS